MPELPEVETTKRGIEPHLVGKKFIGSTLRRLKLRIKFNKKELEQILNKKIVSVTRRAKYILINFSNNSTLLIHLGMTGTLRISNSSKYLKHDHLIFHLVNKKSLIFNPELSLKRGNYSKIKPNKEDQLDIKKAINTLNNLRQYNFSQGVVVRNKKVVSIEGKGGTKRMLEKSRSKKFRNHGVLVKFPKKKQDLRIDLPTIGLKTLKQSKISGLKGIVVKNKQHVFLDKRKCINFANKNKMFISVK